MKTPQELLLERHREAQPKLDAIRRKVLATAERERREHSSFSLRDILRSFRWHLAGMSAIWAFILFLHMDAGRAPLMSASVPSMKIPSPQVILVSLRENRRQLSEMIDSRPLKNEPHELFLPKPRSERHTELLTA